MSRSTSFAAVVLVNEIQQRRIGSGSYVGLKARRAFPAPAITTLHDTLQAVFRSGQSQVLREQPLGWENAANGASTHPYLDTVYQPIRAESGEVESIVVYTVDVSDCIRARTEAAAAFEEADSARERLVRLPSEIETVLYRVVQEAMTNVARHACASHVTVIIEQRPGSVIAIVEDNGIGCDPENYGTEARLGWVGMRERALSVGGSLDIESQRGRGTTVIVSVPVAEAHIGRSAL